VLRALKALFQALFKKSTFLEKRFERPRTEKIRSLFTGKTSEGTFEKCQPGQLATPGLTLE
jgi:hypothetical protein